VMILRWLVAFGALAYSVLPSVALEKEYRSRVLETLSGPPQASGVSGVT
jgi:hypothetical protein